MEKELHVRPQQTKLARVKVVEEQKADPGFVGVATPREGMLAEKMCDFVEELWIEEPTCITTVRLRNWGHCSVVIAADTMIGTVEEASLVTQDDPVWGEPVQLAEAVVRLCQLNGAELRAHQDHLEEQLRIGECSDEDTEALLLLLCSNHQVFALIDTELGETDLVEHNIVTVDNQPLRVSPCRLPYVLRTELEGELIRLSYRQ